jgi:hypothetical protein
MAGAGAVKVACSPEHPAKMLYASFLVMQLLGPSIGCLSLELQAYRQNLPLLVDHGLGMLNVGAAARRVNPASGLCVCSAAQCACRAHMFASVSMLAHPVSADVLPTCAAHATPRKQVLEFLHNNGTVHCDVKPDNLLLPAGYSLASPGPVDTVFIVDFGMATKFTRDGEGGGGLPAVLSGATMPVC